MQQLKMSISPIASARDILRSIDTLSPPVVAKTMPVTEEQRLKLRKWKRAEWTATDQDVWWFQDWLANQQARSHAKSELRRRVRNLLWAHSQLFEHGKFGEAELIRTFLGDPKGWRLQIAPKVSDTEQIENLVNDVANNF